MSKKKVKAVFPKELLNDFIEENNERWISEYRRSTNFHESYYQSLEKFFKFKKYLKKPFNLFTLSDVREYIEVMHDNGFSTNRIDYIISCISSFKTFLIEKHPDIFSEKFLKDLHEFKIDKPEKKYEETQPLNLIQLNSVREFIKYNIRTEYIFEVLYQLGIQKKDFKICLPEYADREKSVFKKKERTIKYNNKIDELLVRIDSIDNFKATYNMIGDHLKKIEDYLKSKGIYNFNKSLTYNDILKTHEKFFIQCPNCGEKHESISINWVLAKADFSNDYYIICSNCKGEPLDETNKS